MQKVIRRTILAEKQAARRKTKRTAIRKSEEAKSNREQTNFTRREESKELKQRRIERREDWELGPLAPRRDVGKLKDEYGTVSTQRMRGAILPKHETEEILAEVGGKYLWIVEGDRVVLLEGKDKGKIGTIKQVDRERAECTVQGLNLIDVAVPKWMRDAEQKGNPEGPPPPSVRTVEKPVPLNTVRIVFPLTDPQTGFTRDVIIKKLVNTGHWWDRHRGMKGWRRVIPGLNINVPWPPKPPKEVRDCAVDTLRVDVETKTFVPTLLRPPMPGSVIDELRNKYSIFRTHHDPEYIAQKMAEDAEKEAKKKLSEEMQTPLKEINRKLRKMRKAKGKPKLTRDMLRTLGETIATKRQASLDAAGMSRIGKEPQALADAV